MAEYKLKTESQINKKEDTEQTKLVIRQAAFRVENYALDQIEKLRSDAKKKGKNIRIILTRDQAIDLILKVAPKALEAAKSDDDDKSDDI